MANATFSVRMDKDLKKNFDALCEQFGMNTSVAINIFARAVVRNRKIPFEISVSTENTGLKAMRALQLESSENGTAGMSLEEINKEIDAVRAEK